MLYRLIKGTFKPETGDPDGDSVRFAPDDPLLLSDLPRGRERPYVHKGNGTINIRYEGIDTLEEYQDPPKPKKNEKKKEEAKDEKKRRFAEEATKKNLELLGTPCGTGETRCYILTKLIGGYGRPIAFVFTGCPPEKDGTCISDGTCVSLDVEWMQKSINFHLICEGYAYPSFYSTLADDLREAIHAKAAEAKRKGCGFWPNDKTCKEVTVEVTSDSKNPLRRIDPIFPKFWRRLKYYREDMGFTGNWSESFTLKYFKEYLKDRGGDRVLIISKSRFTRLHEIIEVEGNTIKMLYGPEDLIFY